MVHYATQSTLLKADLHAHTTASDGSLSPRELMLKAHASELTHIAVSDHDTTGGIDEAIEAARDLNIEVVPAVEVTCEHLGATVHLLGLGVDRRAPSLQHFLDGICESRVRRYTGMIDLLRSACGLKLPPDAELIPANASSLARPRLAQALVRLGHAASVEEVFQRWIGRGKPAHVGHAVPTAAQAMEAVHASGGVSVLAHAGIYAKGLEIARDLAQRGLMGLEVHHPDHDPPVRMRLEKLAREFGLYVTGGADFHGEEHYKSRFFGHCYTNDDDFRRLMTAFAA